MTLYCCNVGTTAAPLRRSRVVLTSNYLHLTTFMTALFLTLGGKMNPPAPRTVSNTGRKIKLCVKKVQKLLRCRVSGLYMSSPLKKERSALFLTLSVKAGEGIYSLFNTKEAPPTPTIIFQRRLELSIYPCT
ncbi:hypothetical protein J6590_087398 [Homalodisca vitripennis]|nr:hypothetical protein J6590_087398 [Homalodisca vitripennis]